MKPLYPLFLSTSAFNCVQPHILADRLQNLHDTNKLDIFWMFYQLGCSVWEWKYYQRSCPPLVLFMDVSYHLLNSSISCNVSMWAVISLCLQMILFNLPLLRRGEPNQGAVLTEFTHWCKTLNIILTKEKRWQLITGKILLSSLQRFEWSGSDVCTEAHFFGLYQWRETDLCDSLVISAVCKKAHQHFYFPVSFAVSSTRLLQKCFIVV